MPFSDFDMATVESDLALTIAPRVSLFSHVPVMATPPEILRALAPGFKLAKDSDNEKAKSEFIIAPMLIQLWQAMGESFGLFTGVELNADSSRGLNGVCDYLLTKSPFQLRPRLPILVIIEAKKDSVHNGLWQAAAAAYAAGLVNSTGGHPMIATYAAASTGIQWLFLKVEGSVVTIDTDQYFITDLGKIFGILKHIIETA